MSHYFVTPDGPERRQQIAARIWGDDYAFTTANGVFSGSRLDLGTSVLLRSVAPPPDGPLRLLDLGCGFGPIAVALARECPSAQVDAVDVNDRALELTRVNAAAAGVRVRVGRPEDFADAVYDQIWSNPPIRVGKEALHELLLTWLSRLARGGLANLVVGRNLGADSLQAWLDGQGWPTMRLASAKGFRVLQVEARGMPDLPTGAC
ncbi:MAG: methyltransferase [Propionibacteriaceae bacterium]|nr:methyltransferase [Propionibacteriaceae bacterium]